MADTMAARLQLRSQIAQAFGGPEQRCRRVTACRRLHQHLQITEQGRVRRRQRLSAGARPAHPIHRHAQDGFGAKLGQASCDRTPRNARNPRDGLHTTTTSSQRLGRRKTPPPALIQQKIKCFEPKPNGVIVDHQVNLALSIQLGNPRHPENHMGFSYLSTGPKDEICLDSCR